MDLNATSKFTVYLNIKFDLGLIQSNCHLILLNEDYFIFWSRSLATKLNCFRSKLPSLAFCFWSSGFKKGSKMVIFIFWEMCLASFWTLHSCCISAFYSIGNMFSNFWTCKTSNLFVTELLICSIQDCQMSFQCWPNYSNTNSTT